MKVIYFHLSIEPVKGYEAILEKILSILDKAGYLPAGEAVSCSLLFRGEFHNDPYPIRTVRNVLSVIKVPMTISSYVGDNYYSAKTFH